MTSSSGNANGKAAEAACMHVVGIGRTGAVYVEALLRTGEIEDLLVDPRATFAALVVDIGDDDMSLAQDYGASFTKRLASRGIPTERYLFQSVVLDPPSAESLNEMLSHTPGFLEQEGGKAPATFEPYVAKTAAMPKPREHCPRAIAKAIYTGAYHAGERPMNAALEAFAAKVKTATQPSIVTVCFSLAGGTGSGIAVDLARHLSAKLGADVTMIGVGQLPHSGDPDTYKDSAALHTTLTELDAMLDAGKNAAIAAAYGETFRSPFSGGFFVVNPEQSWQRLTAYTTTGEARIRQAIKEMVTNRFVADSFMRWCVAKAGHDLQTVLEASKAAHGFMMFDVAKLTHPGVQVLPGEAPSKWEAVIAQWIGFTPKYDGLKDGFKTAAAHVAVYGSRNMAPDLLVDGFQDLMKSHYLVEGSADLPISVTEFFDVLTAYANVVLIGVKTTDLDAFSSSQKTFQGLSGEAKLAEHSWLIDVGPMLSDPSVRFEGLPSQCQTASVVPAEEARNDPPPAPTRKAGAAKPVPA